MKKKKKKGGRRQNDEMDFGTKIDTPLAVSAILFFAVIITLLVRMNIVQTGEVLQNSASIGQIPHVVATTTAEVAQP